MARREREIATSNPEEAMHRIHRSPQRLDIGVGAQVARPIPNQIPRHDDSGKRLFRDPDERVLLVVLQIDVVLRLVRLDQVGFEDQRLELGVRDDRFQITRVFQEGLELGPAVVCERPKVGVDAASQRFGLSDVEDLPFSILDQIDAGRLWKVVQDLRDVRAGLTPTRTCAAWLGVSR